MNRTLVLLLLCSFMLLSRAGTALAGTISASSCASSDVQAAIDSASPQDTVIVPGGNCTWSTTVSIANKALTLRGAGIDQTTITDQGGGGAALSVTGASATNFVNISGFTFTNAGTTGHVYGMVQISGALFSQAFRFHHNKLTESNTGRGLYVYYVYGLVDHNTFEVTGSVGLQTLSVDGSSIGTDGGFTPWLQPLSMGTDNAVYIEDNTFMTAAAAAFGEDTIDAYSGARLVIRYNTFTNAHYGFHGTDSGAIRSPVSIEIYGNTHVNGTGSAFSGMQIRGGTAVIFNNTYAGSSYGAYNLVYHRTDGSGNTSYWQNCNGSLWKLGSTDLSTNASRTCSLTGGVKFCSGNPDLPCTNDSTCSAAGAGACSSYFDGSAAAGYPCRDQPGIGSGGQTSAPIYQWNNTGIVGPLVSSNSFIVANRDFFNNVPKPAYVPYTYPHPLQKAQLDSVPPAAPTNVVVK